MTQVTIDKKESQTIRNHSMNYSFTRCDVCQEEIKFKATIYDSGVNHRVICELCYKRFPKNDLELMLNLFNAYGGYFGKFKKLKSSVYKRLREYNENGFKNNDSSRANQINLQLLHAALLFGFTPQEYFRSILNSD